jgi:hypothetical protein
LTRTIYVGNLPGDIREREVEDLFYKVCFLIHSFVLHYINVLTPCIFFYSFCDLGH